MRWRAASAGGQDGLGEEVEDAVEQSIAHPAGAWALRGWSGLLYRVSSVYQAAAAALICLRAGSIVSAHDQHHGHPLRRWSALGPGHRRDDRAGVGALRPGRAQPTAPFTPRTHTPPEPAPDRGRGCVGLLLRAAPVLLTSELQDDAHGLDDPRPAGMVWPIDVLQDRQCPLEERFGFLGLTQRTIGAREVIQALRQILRLDLCFVRNCQRLTQPRLRSSVVSKDQADDAQTVQQPGHRRMLGLEVVASDLDGPAVPGFRVRIPIQV